tara:strand:+ start:18916 stop:19743 length:828 start_codon:yes stop_codon:yes gene_type:complete
MKEDKTIALVTGGFDPLHEGHITYFESAKRDFDMLIVGINSDKWLLKKKGYFFLSWNERSSIVSSLKVVDEVISFNDEDGSAVNAIEICLDRYKKITFMNGGDRTSKNIPEMQKFTSDRVEFKFGVGGDTKINSSSNILKDFYEKYDALNSNAQNLVEAPWGYHGVIYDPHKDYKIKKIIVNEDQILSLQYHKHRSEHWIIVQGECEVELDNAKSILKKGQHIYIPKLSAHRIKNISKEQKLIFIEVNIGDYIGEDDIVRLADEYGRLTEDGKSN